MSPKLAAESVLAADPSYSKKSIAFRYVIYLYCGVEERGSMRSRGRRFDRVSSQLYSQFQAGELKLEERVSEILQRAAELEGILEKVNEAAKAMPNSENLIAELNKARKILSAMNGMLKGLGQVLEFVHNMGKTWSSLVQEMTEGIAVLQDGQIMYVNRRLTETWGYPVEEVRYRKFTDFMPPDEILRVFCMYERMSQTGQLPERVETAIISKDGERIDVALANWHWIFGGEGAGLVMICDLREKKEMDRKLATYSEYIERIVGKQLEAFAKGKDPQEDVG